MRPVTYTWPSQTTALATNVLISTRNSRGEISLSKSIPDDICQKLRITLGSTGAATCTVTINGYDGVNSPLLEQFNLTANSSFTTVNIYSNVTNVTVTNYVAGNAATDNLTIGTVVADGIYGYTNVFFPSRDLSFSQFSLSVAKSTGTISIDFLASNDAFNPRVITPFSTINWFIFKDLNSANIVNFSNNGMTVTAPTPCTAITIRANALSSGFVGTIQQGGML